jgi:hypothetical protein
MDEQQTITVTNYFGGCPICGQTNGYLNAGKSHCFYCVEHKTSWCVGSNLLSSWKSETEEEQRAKWMAVGMDDFADVKPIPEGTWSADPEKRRREIEDKRIFDDQEGKMDHCEHEMTTDEAYAAALSELRELIMEACGSTAAAAEARLRVNVDGIPLHLLAKLLRLAEQDNAAAEQHSEPSGGSIFSASLEGAIARLRL